MVPNNPERIASELENRKRNLTVIQETIAADKVSGYKLVPVKDFLSRRIESLEQDLKMN
ncbi:MAG: hypothetical protein OK439_00535 [Thaumarchaeota archaeon]|nr:hypothetical protein [Nitrososphaerota archaeon]